MARNWPPASESQLLGKAIARIDGPDLARGAAKFTTDISRPGMLYGEILGSPYPRARVKSIDLSAARALPGVRAAIAIKDPANPATSYVSYQGEEVAAVAATTEAIARDAIRRIAVAYDPLPHVATIEQSMVPGAAQAFPLGNVTTPHVSEAGPAVDAALSAAAHVVESTYATEVQTHASLETHGGIAEWDGDTLLLHVSTQSI